MSLNSTTAVHGHTQVVGASLRDCISKDSSLWVVSRALDSVFDIFGDDNCPSSLSVDIALMPVLQQLVSTFKARVSATADAFRYELHFFHHLHYHIIGYRLYVDIAYCYCCCHADDSAKVMHIT